MPVTFADPFRYTIFGFMNKNKAENKTRFDRRERGLVAGLQLKNAASDVLDMSHGKSGGVMDALNDVSKGIKTARNSSKVFDVVCKGVNFMSKLVNPILVVASGVRAWHADDKKSAAIKEGLSMAGMFAAEGAYKRFFGLGGHAAGYKNYKWATDAAKGFKNFMAKNKYLSKLPAGRTAAMLVGLGFIITSCSAFAIGGSAGKAIADRTTAKQFAKKHPELATVNADSKNTESTSSKSKINVQA